MEQRAKGLARSVQKSRGCTEVISDYIHRETAIIWEFVNNDMPVFEKPCELRPCPVRVGHYGACRLSSHCHLPTIHDPIEMREQRFVQQLREDAFDVSDPVDWDVVRNQFPECDLLAHERLR